MSSSTSGSSCHQKNDDNQKIEERLTKLVNHMEKNIGERAEIADNRPLATIHRVPEALRKLNKSAYTPRLVSIGPLHYNDDHLKSSTLQEDIKMSYVNYLLFRLERTGNHRSVVMRQWVEAMNKLLDRAKSCYEGQVDGVLDEEMLVIDGCFILELLYRYQKVEKDQIGSNNQQGAEDNASEGETIRDLVFGSSLVCNIIQHDLLLLENQLPFFVLEKLFELTQGCILKTPKNLGQDFVLPYFEKVLSTIGGSSKSTDDSSNTKNCCGWPSDYVQLSISGNTTRSELGQADSGSTAKLDNKTGKAVGYHHILHFLHNYYLPLPMPKTYIACKAFKHSASDLAFAGVKFVPSEDRLKVKFSKPEGVGPLKWCPRARFEIPTLHVTDTTEPFFRNLVAFEQCCPEVTYHITWYANLMDKLINTGDDVKVLEKAKVVTHSLGSHEEVSDLFNKLCHEVVQGDFYFAEECESAAQYSESPGPRDVADFRRKYLSSPWTSIAFVVAFIAFGITLTNFIRSFVNGSAERVTMAFLR